MVCGTQAFWAVLRYPYETGIRLLLSCCCFAYNLHDLLHLHVYLSRRCVSLSADEKEQAVSVYFLYCEDEQMPNEWQGRNGSGRHQQMQTHGASRQFLVLMPIAAGSDTGGWRGFKGKHCPGQQENDEGSKQLSCREGVAAIGKSVHLRKAATLDVLSPS